MRMVWAKMRLTAPGVMGGRFKSRPLSLASPDLREMIERAAPTLASYERLAAVYDEYARDFCPDYASFLRALGKMHHLKFARVLELACGAGTLTTQLARVAVEVVALDLSEAMLAEARKRCAHQTNVRFVQGDFRAFHLNETFDAAVCSSDSLNYVHEPSELVQVFRCAARHLNPSALLVFDALDDRGFRRFSGRFIPIEIDGTKCAIVMRYDAENRVENSLVVFGSGSELHRRGPIEPADVQSAAQGSGLAVLDWFSLAGFGLLKHGGTRNFYVLRCPG